MITLRFKLTHLTVTHHQPLVVSQDLDPGLEAHRLVIGYHPGNGKFNHQWDVKIIMLVEALDAKREGTHDWCSGAGRSHQ